MTSAVCKTWGNWLAGEAMEIAAINFSAILEGFTLFLKKKSNKYVPQPQWKIISSGCIPIVV